MAGKASINVWPCGAGDPVLELPLFFFCFFFSFFSFFFLSSSSSLL
jgi:hypothetical protein